MIKVDLHIHTIYSDGKLFPKEVLMKAKENELKIISITDHDEIKGSMEGVKLGKEFGVEVIPGVEISTKYGEKSIHILGYFIDFTHPKLTSLLQEVKLSRLNRAKKILKNLEKAKIFITIEEILKKTPSGLICRPHIGDLLVERRIVSDYEEGFYKYLSIYSPYYVPKIIPSPEEVITTIKEAKGIPILAHPGTSKVKNIDKLIDFGLMGFEVWYPAHQKVEVKRWLEVVNKYNLIPVGGSDSHGGRERYCSIGEFYVNYNVVERLKEVNDLRIRS
jgi:hypothetical protein